MKERVDPKTGEIHETGDGPPMDVLGTIRRLGNGHLLDELADALALVSAEVVETGKPGAVTLTLKVSNREIGDVMVIVQDQITRKLPTKPARGTYVFAVGGGLYSRDPRQVEMSFRAVESTPEIRDTDGSSPSIREA